MNIKRMLRKIGVDISVIKNYKYIPRYYKERSAWLKSGGRITDKFMILSDYKESAGNAKGHYFHQDLLVAQYIFADNPERHIDVGSRIDGFVAHVASFREIEVLDVRPLKPTNHPNIVFRQADLMEGHYAEKVDSISCLHAIEHFGLGRYGDPIDPKGHEKGLQNLISMLRPEGILYISFPIGRTDEVHFNAHRVFHPTTIIDHPLIKHKMELLSFDHVDDGGNLHRNTAPLSVGETVKYGCGIYRFRKLQH